MGDVTLTRYECSLCGNVVHKKTNLAIYGTCRLCGSGFLRRGRGGRAEGPEVKRAEVSSQSHELRRKYKSLTGRDHAVLVPEYDQGWWMGTLCAHDGPEFHVSGLDTEAEVTGAALAVLDFLLRKRKLEPGT